MALIQSSIIIACERENVECVVFHYHGSGNHNTLL